jgi:hypothetical protein
MHKATYIVQHWQIQQEDMLYICSDMAPLIIQNTTKFLGYNFGNKILHSVTWLEISSASSFPSNLIGPCKVISSTPWRCMGEWHYNVALHIHKLSTEWCLMVSFTHWMFKPWGKCLQHPMNSRLGGPHLWYGCCEEENICGPYQEL